MELTPTQERFLSLLKNKISKEEATYLYLIKGNAGTGKTTISYNIHKDFNDIAYFFDSTNSIRDIINKPSIKDFKTFILKNGRTNSFGENVLTSILFLIALIPIAYQIFYLLIVESRLFFLRRSSKKSIESIYEDEKQSQFYKALRQLLWLRNIYYTIGRFHLCKNDKKKQVHNILIFDEINFYNDKSLDYIQSLYLDLQLRKVSPVFAKLGIIINYCTDYHTSSKLKELISICKKENIFELNTYSNSDIEFLCSEYDDETKKTVENSLKKVKSISLHSNLAITVSLIKYINDHKDVNTFKFNIQSNYEILRKYYDNENGLKETLELLSLTPDNALVKEIIELSKLMSSGKQLYDIEVKNILFKASKKKIINPKDIDIIVPDNLRLSFVESQFKDYFQPKDSKFIKTFYMQFAEVMKIVNPGDYLERGYYYLQCGDYEKAELFRFMHFAQACYTDTVDEIDDIEFNHYEKYAAYLKEAYKVYYRGNFEELPYLIDKMNLCKVNTLARFEQDLLKCKIMLVSADKKVIDEVRRIMTEYFDVIDKEEREITVRIKLVLLIVELYDGNNNVVKKIYREILSASDMLSRIDGRYDYHQFSVLRRSIISNEIEIAHVETQKSTNYFYLKTLNSNSHFFRREYFCSLINLSATFRYQGNYESAYNEAFRALEIYKKYPEDLPKVTLYNALATTAFESGTLSGEDAVEMYLKPIEKYINVNKSTESTDYFILNNIACIEAYRDLNIAYEYIEKAIRILNNSSDSIKSHKYRLFTNKAVLLYLRGNVEKALEIILEVKNLQTFPYSESYHLGRYNALVNIFTNQRVGNIFALNMLMEKENPSRTSIEKHYNKSLHI